MNISELPQDIKEFAYKYFDNKDDKDDNLSTAFVWEETKEGYKYWAELHCAKELIKETSTEPKNYDDVIAIIETKIATMSARGFESYYLPIGILKDLIREIKEIK